MIPILSGRQKLDEPFPGGLFWKTASLRPPEKLHLVKTARATPRAIFAGDIKSVHPSFAFIPIETDA